VLLAPVAARHEDGGPLVAGEAVEALAASVGDAFGVGAASLFDARGDTFGQRACHSATSEAALADGSGVGSGDG
jgi:hypothetical protein